MVGGTALGVWMPGQAFALQWAIGKTWFHYETPVTDPKDPFCDGGVGWGWPQPVKRVISEARKGPKGRDCLA